MNIVCVGDCGIDRYTRTGEERCGGISLNFSIHARRAFPPSDVISVVSAVGDDAAGDRVLECLRHWGVHAHVRRLAGTTPMQPIQITADGDRVFHDYRAGVLDWFVPDANAQAAIGESDVLVVPLYTQIQRLFEAVVNMPTRGIRVVDFADIADDLRIERVLPFVDLLDIAFFGVSLGDAAFIDELKRIAVAKDKLFVITLGPDGSLAVDRSGVVTCDARPVSQVVDTTGAGDAFAAAFLAVHCHGGSAEEALDAGARRAAEVIAHVGGQ